MTFIIFPIFFYEADRQSNSFGGLSSFGQFLFSLTGNIDGREGVPACGVKTDQNVGYELNEDMSSRAPHLVEIGALMVKELIETKGIS